MDFEGEKQRSQCEMSCEGGLRTRCQAQEKQNKRNKEGEEKGVGQR